MDGGLGASDQVGGRPEEKKEVTRRRLANVFKHELGEPQNPGKHLGDQSRRILDSPESRPRKNQMGENQGLCEHRCPLRTQRVQD